MLVLLSPAKTLDFSAVDVADVSQPRLLDQTAKLATVLKKKSPKKLQELMHISEKLAKENADRYARFNEPDNIAAAKPALLAFKGDVYRGLAVEELNAEELGRSQQHIRILSGMYGVLRPLDLMQPYRLEMGTKLKVGRHNDLYAFWGDALTKLLQEDVASTGANFVLNAASKEYFSSLQLDELGVPVLEADFKELRDGKLKFITYNAKMARGKLAQLVVKHRITQREDLADLDVLGYGYDAERSTDSVVAFTKVV